MTKRRLGAIFVFCGCLLPFMAFLSLSLGNRKARKSVPEEVISEKDVQAYEANRQKGTSSGDPFEKTVDNTVYPENFGDKVYATLSIPSIDMTAPVRLGASEEHLLTGLAHVAGSSLPLGGPGTRCLIAGHRGMRDGIMFGGLGKVKAGDQVILRVKGKRLLYVVYETEIIAPDDGDRVGSVPGKDLLSLITCDPLLPPRNKRLLVNCERVLEKPADKNQKALRREKKETQPAPGEICDLLTGGTGLVLLGAALQVVRIFKEEKDS